MTRKNTSSIVYPKCVVFDLDYTLWPLWIDTHVTPPFRADEKNSSIVWDRYGTAIQFYDDVVAILQDLRDHGVSLCLASRTCEPKYAFRVLDLMKVTIDGKKQPAKNFFAIAEIYPGSKITHMQNISKKLNIEYKDMLFFDDESRNREVERLGVTFQLLPDGLNKASSLEGYRAFAMRNGLSR
ncbi:acid phosphatase [Schizosaccharomyces japonicus yFS275]|uniref:Acid phosphatase n=1 Tax=Schizosaccharomyces japonicus (strain yFS275 / FY16936) TaxID=402676 RepID=B6K2D7_SCHJY|nr:acid phosphatase [Schizosaccharomyces japonicus yFS275]EEB07318.2 acid phosphatase [Schizosaccharomyces japonicus yFS275]